MKNTFSFKRFLTFGLGLGLFMAASSGFAQNVILPAGNTITGTATAGNGTITVDAANTGSIVLNDAVTIKSGNTNAAALTIDMSGNSNGILMGNSTTPLFKVDRLGNMVVSGTTVLGDGGLAATTINGSNTTINTTYNQIKGIDTTISSTTTNITSTNTNIGGAGKTVGVTGQYVTVTGNTAIGGTGFNTSITGATTNITTSNTNITSAGGVNINTSTLALTGSQTITGTQQVNGMATFQQGANFAGGTVGAGLVGVGAGNKITFNGTNGNAIISGVTQAQGGLYVGPRVDSCCVGTPSLQVSGQGSVTQGATDATGAVSASNATTIANGTDLTRIANNAATDATTKAAAVQTNLDTTNAAVTTLAATVVSNSTAATNYTDAKVGDLKLVTNGVVSATAAATSTALTNQVQSNLDTTNARTANISTAGTVTTVTGDHNVTGNGKVTGVLSVGTAAIRLVGGNVAATGNDTISTDGAGADGNLHLGSTTALDAAGQPVVGSNKVNVVVDTSLSVVGDHSVGGNLSVQGTASFTNGADMGGAKVTNVANGTVAAGSKDAVNGGQLAVVSHNAAVALASEVTRAQNAESALGAQISSTNAALASESSRAQSAEAALGSRIDATNANLATETATRVSEVARVDGRIDATNAKVTTEVNRLDGKIDTESARAQVAETGLSNRLDTTNSRLTTEVARVDTRIDSTNAALTAETARAMAEEKKVAKDLSTTQNTLAAIVINTLGNDVLPEQVKDAGISLSANANGVNIVKSLDNGMSLAVGANGVSVAKSQDVAENLRIHGSIGSTGVSVGAFIHSHGNGIGLSTTGPAALIGDVAIPLTPSGFIVSAVTGAYRAVTGKTQREIAGLKADNTMLKQQLETQAVELEAMKAQISAIMAAQAAK